MVAGIVVELSGVDGAGKSTLIDRLGARLSARGVTWTRCKLSLFGNPAYNRYLGILGEPFSEASATAAQLRSELISLETLRFGLEEVLAAVSEVQVVLCDRYVESIRCLLEGYGLLTSRFVEITALIPGNDVWLHLDIATEAALARRHRLGERPGMLEQQGLAILADRLMSHAAERACVVLDASLPPDKLADVAAARLWPAMAGDRWACHYRANSGLTD